MPNFIMSHEEMSDFASFPLLGFTLVIKLRHFDFEGHWNTLTLYSQKKHMVSDLNMSLKKMTGFFSFPLFGVALVIKLKNFDFEGY